MSEEIRQFVKDILDGDLYNAREEFKTILARRKRERSMEFLNQADSEWRENLTPQSVDNSDSSE
jgi:hypothetical protein